MIKRNKWIFLSYALSDTLSAYGDGNRIKFLTIKNMLLGDTSNNMEFHIPSHFGTHIDFPYHFSINGKTLNNYNPDFFIFNSVGFLNLDLINRISNYLIKEEHINNFIDQLPKSIDLLLIKTGFCNIRNKEDYWKHGYGFDLGMAKFLRNKFGSLRAIGFDLISLSSYQKRNVGREAHREFLSDNNILIIEDMDLSLISKKQKLNQVIVSPLQINMADGVPVTIFANITYEEN